MKFSYALTHLISALLIAGCASTSESRTAAIAPTAPRASPGEAIDAILYSNASRDVMLTKLKPYATQMEPLEDLKKRLEFGSCFGSGPGVTDCKVAASGLRLVFDPDGKLRLIRRQARTVNGIAYPEMSITERGFEWKGYARWYPN